MWFLTQVVWNVSITNTISRAWNYFFPVNVLILITWCLILFSKIDYYNSKQDLLLKQEFLFLAKNIKYLHTHFKSWHNVVQRSNCTEHCRWFSAVQWSVFARVVSNIQMRSVTHESVQRSTAVSTLNTDYEAAFYSIPYGRLCDDDDHRLN